jgi:hypothetical protein
MYLDRNDDESWAISRRYHSANLLDIVLKKIVHKTVTHHGSHRVYTKMNHRKGNDALLRLSILQSISKPPSILGEDILSNHEQPVASSSHTIMLILRGKKKS